MWRRLLVALFFCGACLFWSPIASWAADGDPAPMPAGGGVPDVWRCSDEPMPAATATVTPDPVPTPADTPTATVTPAPYPVPTPTGTESRCRVTSWAALPAAPTTTITPDPSASGDPVSDVRVVELGPSTMQSVWDSEWPLLFLLGALVMAGVCWLVFHLSRPPMYGTGS
jgi:hypothetical protein